MAIKIHKLLTSFTTLRHGKVVLIVDLRRSAPRYMTALKYNTLRLWHAAVKHELPKKDEPHDERTFLPQALIVCQQKQRTRQPTHWRTKVTEDLNYKLHKLHSHPNNRLDMKRTNNICCSLCWSSFINKNIRKRHSSKFKDFTLSDVIRFSRLLW